MGRTLPLAGRSTDGEDADVQLTTAGTLLDLCVAPQRRIVLEALCESGPLSMASLADRVAARRLDVAPGSVTEEAHERAAVGLHHNHLPKLSDAGFVELAEDDDATMVSLTHRIESDRIRDLIESAQGSWEELNALLGEDRRRHVVTLLLSADGPLALDEIAKRIAERECSEVDATDGEHLESIRVSLHHLHLPTLTEVGILDYDPETRFVDLEGLPDAYEAVETCDSEAVAD